MRRAAKLLVGVLAVAGTSAGAEAPATLAGRVGLAVEVDLDALGPLVVFLDGANGSGVRAVPSRTAEIRQAGATFEPDFLVVAAGQRVSMPNDDTIYHNVFSYSKPNDFDLGYYPGGESRDLTFEHPGVVQLYCSIHESMNGTIFVAPSPYYSRVGPDGGFRIEDVPPGTYRVGVWSRMLPPVERTVTLPPGGSIELDLALGVPEP